MEETDGARSHGDKCADDAAYSMGVDCGSPGRGQPVVCNAIPCSVGGGSAADGRELVVGTKIAPPFAMRDESGNWTGISIELWRHVADPLKWRYRFVEVATMPELLDGLSTGNFDVGVAAISVTAERQQTVDFSTPYFTAGTGVAFSPIRSPPGCRGASIVSMSSLQAILALLGLAVTAGVLIWLFERKANGEFGGGVTHGVSTGVWWSTHTMTQRATGGPAPMTLPGRIIAMIWMVTSVIAIAVFTAGLTSALTTSAARRHQWRDRPVLVRVDAIAGTSTIEHCPAFASPTGLCIRRSRPQGAA